MGWRLFNYYRLHHTCTAKYGFQYCFHGCDVVWNDTNVLEGVLQDEFGRRWQEYIETIFGKNTSPYEKALLAQTFCSMAV